MPARPSRFALPSGPRDGKGRVTSQGTAHGRFARAIQQRNLFQAELALREMRDPSLVALIDYLELLADARPDKFDKAAARWHGRLELECAVLTIAESELALAALGALRAGDKEAVGILRRLLGAVFGLRVVRQIGSDGASAPDGFG